MDIQNLSERYNFYIQKVEYIENLDFIGESYGKNHKRSLYQKVALFGVIVFPIRQT